MSKVRRRLLLHTSFETPNERRPQVSDFKDTQCPGKAKTRFDSGNQHYTDGEYKEAVKAFNLAYSYGYDRYEATDGIAKSLLHLGEAPLWAAHSLMEDLCKRFGETRPEPWLRMAEILSLLGWIPAAVRALNTARPMVPDEGECHDRFLELEIQTSDSMEDISETENTATGPTGVADLPNDIVIAIGLAGLAIDPEFPIRLARICTKWRVVVLDTPLLWSRLWLKSKPVLKARLWLKYSKGVIHDLHIDDRRFSKVQSQSIAGLIVPVLPQVRSFYTTFISLHWNQQFGTLRHLRFDIPPCSPRTRFDLEELLPKRNPSLKTLEIHVWHNRYHEFRTSGWKPFLSELEVLRSDCDVSRIVPHAPRLKVLAIPRWNPPITAIGKALLMSHLTHLELSGCNAELDAYGRYAFPRLNTLSLPNVKLLLTPPIRGMLHNLVSLQLSLLTDTVGLEDAIPQLVSLRHLKVQRGRGYYDVDGASLDRIMAALTVAPTDPARPVPLLTALSIDCGGNYTGDLEQLITMVRSRATGPTVNRIQWLFVPLPGRSDRLSSLANHLATQPLGPWSWYEHLDRGDKDIKDIASTNDEDCSDRHNKLQGPLKQYNNDDDGAATTEGHKPIKNEQAVATPDDHDSDSDSREDDGHEHERPQKRIKI